MVKAAVTKVTVMEAPATEVPAVRLPSVMVEGSSTAVPVVAPVAPAPAKSSEEADAKSDTKGKAHAAPKNSGHGIPTRGGNHGPSIPQARVIGGGVPRFGVSRFDDDGV